MRRCSLLLLLPVVSVALLQSEPLGVDRGAAGTWQKLLKLQTTASALHTTAHPDDEHGGMLAWLSRGLGVRVALLTLNRGEAGDNAIGPELFDALGLIRTEELRVAGRYYGLDPQYFTTVVDYGYSKRVEEAFEKWGRERTLADIVRVIRIERPLVLISRFHGTPRDGHGNHEAAGLLTQEAFEAAADPGRFPDQIAEGLQPWRPMKLYIGGLRETEDWTVRVDAGEFSPVLGESYQTFARIGLSFQRSQNGGRLNAQPGPAYGYYKRVDSGAPARREADFFEGLDTSIAGIPRLLGFDASPAQQQALQRVERAAQETLSSFKMTNPSASVPALARGLAATREALEQLVGYRDAVRLLRIKESQFMEAIDAALAFEVGATAVPADYDPPDGAGSAFAPPPVAGPAVPGQPLGVLVGVTPRGQQTVRNVSVELDAPDGWTANGVPLTAPSLGYNQTLAGLVRVEVPPDARVSRPHFSRRSLSESRYEVDESRWRFQPAPDPPLAVRVRYEVEGVPVHRSTTVRRWESRVPYGFERLELEVLPRVGVRLEPSTIVVPAGSAGRRIAVRVELEHNGAVPSQGEMGLDLPPGWTAEPSRQPFGFDRPGERAVFGFDVDVPAVEAGRYSIDAFASVDGREFREGYQTIRHRDLETRYLFARATSEVRGIDIEIAPGLSVGYVMGIGDDVPAALGQLGAQVQLLDRQALASADLSRFDAIMTGTRAYAVRDDLRTYNRRLLDYVREGGHLIVLYNTQELDPGQFAPYPGELTRAAEEVSEEDSPVEILAPAHPVLQAPNRITAADFQGWVEQRGSKFWSAWDDRYTAIIATHDTNQPPQAGGWLTAGYGDGQYTYFAYALHRQLPYGVPGAYRLLANLLSLTAQPGR